MAGSLNHLVADNGAFTFSLIDSFGDALEATEECFHIIRWLTNGDKNKINDACHALNYPPIQVDLIDGEPEYEEDEEIWEDPEDEEV